MNKNKDVKLAELEKLSEEFKNFVMESVTECNIDNNFEFLRSCLEVFEDWHKLHGEKQGRKQ